MEFQTAIYYYSATGNSLWVAKQLQSELSDSGLFPMIRHLKQDENGIYNRVVGLVIPTHKFGLPDIVRDFLKTVQFSTDSYVFAVVTGGNPFFGAGLHQIKKLLKKQNIKLKAGFHIKMPATYFSFFSHKSFSEKSLTADEIKENLKRISSAIRNKENILESGVGILNLINRLKIKGRNNSFKKFHIDEGCIRCGYCVMVCPMQNIRIINKEVVISENCNTCFACVHYCSQGVLQYGRLTSGRQRYQHPAVSIGDLMEQKR